MPLRLALAPLLLAACIALAPPAGAQTPPSASEVMAYAGLHAAAQAGDAASIARLAAGREKLDARDGHGRTPLMVAAHGRHLEAARALIRAGADVNLLDSRQYDALTIAAVNNDIAMVRLLIEAGADASLVTSPYDGTALIAAAHLGHAEVVRALIRAGAPLDHVNNLRWTALIEAIVLGDGGPDHIATLRALVEAGANVNLPDGSGQTPLALAKARGHQEMVQILQAAGARP